MPTGVLYFDPTISTTAKHPLIGSPETSPAIGSYFDSFIDTFISPYNAFGRNSPPPRGLVTGTIYPFAPPSWSISPG